MTTSVNNKINELIGLLRAYGEEHGEEQMPDELPSSNPMMDGIISKVKAWYPSDKLITYKDLKKRYKDEGFRPPNNKDINLAFVDSNDFCISNTGNKSALIRITDEDREKERRAHAGFIDEIIRMKESMGFSVDDDVKTFITKTLAEMGTKQPPAGMRVARLNMPEGGIPQQPQIDNTLKDDTQLTKTAKDSDDDDTPKKPATADADDEDEELILDSDNDEDDDADDEGENTAADDNIPIAQLAKNKDIVKQIEGGLQMPVTMAQYF